MSRIAPLLRALLCLALLLNGTAYAHAATRMAMGDMAAAVEAAGDAMPPCHEGMDMDMDMAMPMDDLDASKAVHHDNNAGLADCCKAGSCDGFCSQHAPAMTCLAAVRTPLYPAAEAPAYRADAHTSVRLAHRYRPPILAA